MYGQRGYLSAGPIQPVAGIGEKILVRRVQNWVLYPIVYIEQIPESSPVTIDLIANSAPVVANIAAGGSLLSQSLQNPLQMDGLELGQFRIRIYDNIELQFYEPQALPRFVTMQARARFSKFGQVHDQHLSQSEIWIFQSEWPFVDVFNRCNYVITSATVGFSGLRYRLGPEQRISNNLADFANDRYTAVMAEGFIGIGFQNPGLPPQ